MSAKRSPRGASLSPTTGKARCADLLSRYVVPRAARRYRRHADVFGVGFGLKETQGELSPGPIPCVKFFVHRKGFAVGRTLPPALTHEDAAGRTVVPTDVEPLYPITLQPGARRVASPGLTAGPRTGSIAALVLASNRRFVLTAAHVLSGLTAESSRVLWDVPGEPGYGQGNLVQDSLWLPAADFAGSAFTRLDAGLAEIEIMESLGNEQLFPWGTGVVKWEEATGLDAVTICGANGMVTARWDGVVPPGVQVVVHGQVLPYSRLLRFRLLSKETQPGDSGAAVVSGDGRLVGMHLGIMNGPSCRWAVALCAGDLLGAVRSAIGDDSAGFFRLATA